MTFHEGTEEYPRWTPDGKRIVFASNRNQRTGVEIYWKSADGTGEVQLLFESEHDIWPAHWHSSGKFLAYTVRNPQGADVFIMPVEGDGSGGLRAGEPQPFLTGPFNESEPRFSPDGRFIAYVSNESGQFEVYVRPFPDLGGRWQISTGGGDYLERLVPTKPQS